eukprot:7752142-Pyramimonas_sp.AAC.1
MSVTYGENENFLSQQRAIEELQHTYHLDNIKTTTTTPMLTEREEHQQSAHEAHRCLLPPHQRLGAEQGGEDRE